jgi:hypothetical protein
VAGSGATAAVQRARDLAADGVAASLDLFGGLVRDPAEADRVTGDYLAWAGPAQRLECTHWSLCAPKSVGKGISAYIARC